MKLSIQSYEIELTTRCNAACPGCARTHAKSSGKLETLDLNINHIKKIFDGIDLSGSMIYLCGTLGDPLSNRDILEITEYLLDSGAKIEIHTNGGLRNKSFWESYGELSKFFNKMKPESMKVVWNVDGIETNHIYRVGVNIKSVLKNMECYIKSGGFAEWRYIKFDWNVDEIELARKQAEQLGINFKIRSAWRNSNGFKIIEIVPKEYTYNPESIVCKHLDRKEVFISADGRIWPCCFIRDEDFKHTKEAQSLFDNYGVDFNNTYTRSITEIMEEPLFKFSAPKEEWDSNSKTFISRCYRSCDNNGARLAKNVNYEDYKILPPAVELNKPQK